MPCFHLSISILIEMRSIRQNPYPPTGRYGKTWNTSSQFRLFWHWPSESSTCWDQEFEMPRSKNRIFWSTLLLKNLLEMLVYHALRIEFKVSDHWNCAFYTHNIFVRLYWAELLFVSIWPRGLRIWIGRRCLEILKAISSGCKIWLYAINISAEQRPWSIKVRWNVWKLWIHISKLLGNLLTFYRISACQSSRETPSRSSFDMHNS